MSTRYNTGNPIESTDVRDMSDNAKNLDLFSNSSELSFDDRFGVERKTIHGMNSEFDAQILNMGFTRVGTFLSGATLTNPRQTLLWDTANGGDGQEYGWSGTFPKIVPPSSTPSSTGGIAVGAWMSRFDPELKVQVREALRRSYAEAGYNLVEGSFEAGGTVTSATDVLLYESDGKAYSWSGVFQKEIPTNSTPASTGGVANGAWHPVGDVTLRSELAEQGGAAMIGYGTESAASALDQLKTDVSTLSTIHRTYESFGAIGDGATDDAPALQEAFTWLAEGDYRKVTVGKPGAKYKVNTGLVIPWDNRFQDIGSTRYVDFEGSVLIAGAANITVLKMCHNFIHVNRPIVVNPAAYSNVTAYAIEPETNQTISQVSQMHCTMTHPSADGVYTGIRFGVGPTIAGQDSGAFWFTIFHPFCNNVALAWHFAPSSTHSCNITRIVMYNPVHTNGNTTWLLENANSLYTYGGSSENITIGTTPSATPTVFLGRDPVPAGNNMAIFADCHFTNYYVEVATRLYSIPGSNGAIANSFTNLSVVGVSQRPTGNGEPTFNHRTWGSSVVTSTELGGGLKLGIQAGDGSNHQAFMYMVNDATTTEVELFSDRGWKFVGMVKGMTASDSVKAAFDGAVNLGQPSNRWATVYAAVGAINTSDVRYKVPTADTIQAEIIADVERREYEAASEIKKSIYSYKFTDAVAKKGEANARIHFGVGAQIVGEIMRRHNLAPEEYAFWCYDEWAYTPAKVSESGNVYEPEIPAGDRYGIRYDELIMFLLKYS